MTTPFVSLLLDVAGAAPADVERSVASVRDQSLGDWELLVHGGAGPTGDDTGDEPRIRVLAAAGTPAERVRAACAEASGELLAVLSAGETLTPDALATFAAAVGPETDLAYADQLLLDDLGHETGTLRQTLRQPLWSPERLLGHLWLARPTLLRTAVVAHALRDEPLGEAWEHDLVLRVAATARGVERVPAPLLSGSRRTPAGSAATADAVRAHLARVGVPAVVEPGATPGTARVRRTLPDDLAVAVVVACQGARGLAWGERRWFVVEAVRSVLRHAGDQRLEVVVVHHRTLEESVLDALLALDERVRLVPVQELPDRPEMLNAGVLSTHADVVVLMDEHTEVGSEGFLAELVGPLTDEGVGLTAPRVLASDGNLLHAGLAFHQHRVELMHEDAAPGDPGPDGLLGIAHECSGLGGGCLALRRTTFDAVGGLRQDLHVLDDVDLSFKVRAAGLRRVWVPGATVYDLVDRHKVAAVHRVERQLVRARWLAPLLDEYAPTYGAWFVEREGEDQRRLVLNRSSTSR